MLAASIGHQVTHTFTVFFSWLPHLVGALVVLVVGYLVARVVGRLVARILQGAGLDKTECGLHVAPATLIK